MSRKAKGRKMKMMSSKPTWDTQQELAQKKKKKEKEKRKEKKKASF